MAEMALENEALIRLSAFLGMLAVMLLWETYSAFRTPLQPKVRRWLVNGALVIVDTVAVRLTIPVLAVAMAGIAAEKGWGLLNLTGGPSVLVVLLGVVLLDLSIYGQHVLMHKVALLWRLHRMHHSDVDFDASTAVRFHPLEIVFSMLVKLGAIAALGPAPLAVLIFEVLLNATAIFNHGNVHIPARVDALLRWFVVTPDMHRIHHSVLRMETDSNFGFNLPWWDRLFGTYRNQPRGGHTAMTIGLETFRESRFLKLHWLLVQPFMAAPVSPRPSPVNEQN
jgi:sterol desaturase/sphingolipid hydroxylase (fatty acid hydroxylase superfamily)